jgi:hypothetical protein
VKLSDIESKPSTAEVRLLLDGELETEIADLRAELRVARREDVASGGGLSDRAPAIVSRLTELDAEADERAVVFRFRAIGRGTFEKLIAKHPPTTRQWEEWREKTKAIPIYSAPEYDDVGLSVDLVAACCVDPVGSSDEWKVWRDDKLSDGQWAELYSAALKVNTQASIRPTYGIGTDGTASSGPASTTPPPTGSPSPSSMVES